MMQNLRANISRHVVYDKGGNRINKMVLTVQADAQSTITDTIIEDAFRQVLAYMEDLEHDELVSQGRMLARDRKIFDPKG